jgi:hypothetical protein
MSQEMTVLEFEFLCRINAKEWSPTGWSSCKVTQDFFELKRSPYSSLTSKSSKNLLNYSLLVKSFPSLTFLNCVTRRQ